MQDQLFHILMVSADYSILNRNRISGTSLEKVMAIDLETLVDRYNGFLTGERIIAISVSMGHPDIETRVMVAEEDSKSEEDRIIREFDSMLEERDPDVLIGYNHTGYDLPLLQLKMRNRPYSQQFWNLKYYLGTAYTMDMMYVIAHDLHTSGENFRIRKLRDAVNHEKYEKLPLMRAKDLVVNPNMNVGEAIKNLWLNDRKNFEAYCQGDTHDILRIFYSIFG
ncbi:hypothetical protein IX51_08105 [uncultured archaeon]|nr:hypothetical protein IX51_08105 [uncultured archaeon]